MNVLHETRARRFISRLWFLPAVISAAIIAVSVALSFSPTSLSIIGMRRVNIALYYSVISFAASGLFVLSIIFHYEGSSSGTKEIAIVGTLAALSAASRLVIPIPNFKPCTFLIVISGYVFGPEAGVMIGVLTPAISNMFLGQGPWTVWQMLMWSVAGWSGGAIRKRFGNVSIETLSAYNFAWGFIFGMPLDFFTWLSYNGEAPLIPIMVAGIPFNIVDAVGNLIFTILLGSYTIKILERYRDRFRVKYTD
ncbi:MAG: ECF transporter S component [Candidatus Thermoplasmatota archaeon]|nr:ECF transporter S component [Candidatus Thermoplasmatota archaeon]